LESDLGVAHPVSLAVRTALVHVLEAEQQWRGACQAGEQWPDLYAEDFPNAQALQKVFADEQGEWRTFVGGLDDGSMDAKVEWTNSLDEVSARPLWQVLYHVFNHGTQHRAEIASLLSQNDRSPADLDLILFLWEQEHSSTAPVGFQPCSTFLVS
jgi:uncharacterized damage-inducible protein DinB